VDVRVLDREGNPITDLTAADFTVLEDGVPQKIEHFSTQAYAVLTQESSAQLVLREGPGLQRSPVTHRTFLIVLGRGRLQEPSKGMDAIVAFVRSRLLPQDRVAVMAYNRATDLTTDREAVVRLLERYRKRHLSIEARLDHWFRGLQVAFGSRDIPRGAQAEIDALFEAAPIPDDRESPAGPKQLSSLSDLVPKTAARQDLEKLYAGLAYLRFLEGEKHIIFLTEQVPFLGLRRSDSLAAMAADARVAISPIQTGGVPLRWSHPNLQGPSPPTLISRTWTELWAFADAQTIAEQTGGMASFYRYADAALDRLNRATRFQYLLGYYPANATWDGKYRTVSVTVNRPDVTVLYRHGYYAQPQLEPYDRRRFMSHARIAAAGISRYEIRSIPVTVSASPPDGHQAANELDVELRVDPSRVTFTLADEHYRASLDVAVFVGDARQTLIGEAWERIDLNLDATAHARLLRDRIVHTTTVKVTGRPRHVKAVVYDHESDRLGTAVRRLQ
jgi:VWFA-related protein